MGACSLRDAIRYGNANPGTTITVLRPGQAAQSVTVLGAPRDGDIGDDGTVAFTTRTSSSLAYVTVFRDGQEPVTATTTGLISNPATVGPDGTVYLFATTTGGTVSLLTVVPLSGPPVTLTFPGSSFGVTVNPTGSGATLVTYTDDTVNGTRTYTVHAITVPRASTL